jgi:glutathione reductase (NADPH)
MYMKSYDVIVIGAGTGGQTAAVTLAENGLAVAVVEESDRPGGICALAGCQAKKWYYEAADAVARGRHLVGKGIVAPPAADWSAVYQQKRLFTDGVPENTVKNLKGWGVDLITGSAVFQDGNTIMVNGEPVRASYFIIASGAHPMPLPIEGARHMITSTDFLDLVECPPRLVFVGGGFISFEFACFAAYLGGAKQITILEAASRPLTPFDADMVVSLMEAVGDAGVEIVTGVTIKSVEKTSRGYRVTTGTGVLEADRVVHGAGRVPRIASLKLENCGVVYSKKGVGVDDGMRTGNPAIFAVGDCAATVQLARVADYEGYVAAANILAAESGGKGATIDYRAVPFVLFACPQCAMVGATEEQLQRQGVSNQKSFQQNLGWPSYRRVGLKHAAYKILIGDDRQVLGAHFVSDNATGLVNLFKDAMLDGKTVDELYWRNVMGPYPSRESDVTYMLDPFMEEDYLTHMP